MSYNKWHDGGVLCEVPKSILIELETFFEIFTKRPHHNFKGNYKQWDVQTSTVTSRNIDLSFIHWQDQDLLKNTKLFFKNYVHDIYRFRLSLLDGSSDLDYHSKHQLPRVHIPLNDCMASMVIKDENENENTIPLNYGKAYYINVTKLHKVKVDVNTPRKNAFFCFSDFADKNLKEIYSNCSPFSSVGRATD